MYTPQASHSLSKDDNREAADIFLCAGYKNTIMNNHLSIQEHVQSVSDPSDTEHEEDWGSLTPYNHLNKLPKKLPSTLTVMSFKKSQHWMNYIILIELTADEIMQEK